MGVYIYCLVSMLVYSSTWLLLFLGTMHVKGGVEVIASEKEVKAT